VVDQLADGDFINGIRPERFMQRMYMKSVPMKGTYDLPLGPITPHTKSLIPLTNISKKLCRRRGIKAVFLDAAYVTNVIKATVITEKIRFSQVSRKLAKRLPLNFSARSVAIFGNSVFVITSSAP